MTALIYGGKGWIGQKFVDEIGKRFDRLVVSATRLDDVMEIDRELDRVSPTHVFSFVGRTHGDYQGEYIPTIDYLEKPNKWRENVRDNLFVHLSLALKAQKRGIHLTILSTGCIYTYDDVHRCPLNDTLIGVTGFTEEDLPNFEGSGYSFVKAKLDLLLRDFNNVLVLRIRMPIDSIDNPRNFITKLVKYSKICSIPNSMTVLPDLIPIGVDLAIKNKTGLYNLVNPGFMSHNEILDLYCVHVNPLHTFENFTYDEQTRVLQNQRSNAILDPSKLLKEYPDIPLLKTSVENILKRWS